MPRPYVVAITGASGVRYGIALVRALIELKQAVALVISDAGRLVIREEEGLALSSLTRPDALQKLLGVADMTLVQAYSSKDLAAPIASGSFPVAGMAIVPCSMGTLGAIAGGLSQNLIHRAADCMIKEGRRLVLVPRETPLSAIHLENLLKLARLGVRIVPAMPGFYSGARQIEDLVAFMVGKVLDQLDIEHACYPRWVGSLSAIPDEAEESR